MKSIKFIGASALALVLGHMVAAQASASSGPQPITTDALTGTWELPCQVVDGENVSGTMTFVDGELVIAATLWGDSACTKKDEGVINKYTYTLGGVHGSGEEIDLNDNGDLSYAIYKITGQKLEFSMVESTPAQRPKTFAFYLNKV